jgi:hypothetical protein
MGNDEINPDERKKFEDIPKWRKTRAKSPAAGATRHIYPPFGGEGGRIFP